MENEVVVFEGSQALAVPKRGGYEITSQLTGTKVDLKRDVDFGVIPKTKTPSLFKAGAEKIILAYGLLQHYEIISKIEEVSEKTPFFMYTVRCDLVRVSTDGKEYVFTSGMGSANTMEKRNGFNSAYDAANSSLKMACKRAMVAAAINIGGLSSMFSQDIEDEKFMTGYDKIQDTLDPESRITAKQVKRLYAIAYEAGYPAAEAKRLLAANNITKASEIKQKDYDAVCALFTTTKGNNDAKTS